MNRVIGRVRRVVGIGLAWALVWAACWVILFGIILLVDPRSMDRGDPTGMVLTLGPMGVLSGLAFGALLSLWGRGRAGRDLRPAEVAGWGLLGSAIVQLAYLDHGDLGLAANVGEAMLLCAFGVVVTMLWYGMARRWSHGAPQTVTGERVPSPQGGARKATSSSSSASRRSGHLTDRLCEEESWISWA